MMIVIGLLFAWMFIGGCFMLLKKLPELKQVKVVKGTIIAWEKQGGPDWRNKYVPVVQYKDCHKEGLRQIVLDKQSSGLFFKPSTDSGLSESRIVWLAINQNGNVKPLFNLIAETMLPVGFIIVGLFLLLDML